MLIWVLLPWVVQKSKEQETGLAQASMNVNDADLDAFGLTGLNLTRAQGICFRGICFASGLFAPAAACALEIDQLLTVFVQEQNLSNAVLDAFSMSPFQMSKEPQVKRHLFLRHLFLRHLFFLPWIWSTASLPRSKKKYVNNLTWFPFESPRNDGPLSGTACSSDMLAIRLLDRSRCLAISTPWLMGPCATRENMQLQLEACSLHVEMQINRKPWSWPLPPSSATMLSAPVASTNNMRLWTMLRKLQQHVGLWHSRGERLEQHLRHSQNLD